MYSLPRRVMLIIWSVSIFYFTHFWINGLLSKQSSLQMVWERLHSTITLLVGYKNFFFPKVSKYMIVVDMIHDTFPLGQTGVYVCVRDHVRKECFFRTSKIASKAENIITLGNGSRRGVVPPASVSGISGKMNTLAPQRIGPFRSVSHRVCVRYLASV